MNSKFQLQAGRLEFTGYHFPSNEERHNSCFLWSEMRDQWLACSVLSEVNSHAVLSKVSFTSGLSGTL